MNPVACDSCGERFPARSLTEDDRRALHDRHSYRELAEELRMLCKVREFYRRHPDAEERIEAQFVRRLLKSDAPLDRGGRREKLGGDLPYVPVGLNGNSFRGPAAVGAERQRANSARS